MAATYQSADPFASVAFKTFEAFVTKALQSPVTCSPNEFERFEGELHQIMAALEADIVGRRLEQYDVDAEEIEVHGDLFRRKDQYEKEYHGLSGSFTVKRTLYVPRGVCGRGIVPLEYRAGIVEGAWTPRLARVMARSVAATTPREAAELFEEFGGYKPSPSSLDRVPKALSEIWESQREFFDQDIREQETVPSEAVAVGVSLDGVLVPMQGESLTDGDDRGSTKRKRKATKGPAGYQEASCGTISFYDADGERLETVRYARAPEHKKATLKSQLKAELESIFAVRPDLTLVCLSDGALDHWEFLDELGESLGVEDVRRATDFFHVAEHVKKALDVYHGQDSAESRAEFEKHRIWLKEEKDGAERVLRALRYRRNQLRGSRKAAITKEINHIAKGKKDGLLGYKELRDDNLPIGSGIVEAACKTLVTERLKRSGMNWGQDCRGAQAILTLRSLIQSNRWEQGWRILSRQYCPKVRVTACPPENRRKHAA